MAFRSSLEETDLLQGVEHDDIKLKYHHALVICFIACFYRKTAHTFAKQAQSRAKGIKAAHAFEQLPHKTLIAAAGGRGATDKVKNLAILQAVNSDAFHL
jgi:hypothetical protein